MDTIKNLTYISKHNGPVSNNHHVIHFAIFLCRASFNYLPCFPSRIPDDAQSTFLSVLLNPDSTVINQCTSSVE